MGILDDTLVNAKSVAKLVSKKAVDVYDVSKLKITSASLKAELNKKYMAYGKAIYNSEDKKLIEKLEKSIEETKQNLADVTKLYDSIKNSSVCVVCGEKIPANAHFCPVCGTTQETGEDYCPNCNQLVDADSFYCIHCGKKINKE